MSKPNNPYYKIVKNQSSKEATIYIYGVIGGYDWEKGEYINTASKFTEEFKEVENEFDTIHVRINSPGGYVFEGLAIHNALYGSSKKIITYNDGLCASMAFLIFLSGDERKGYKNSLLMAHNSSSIYIGNKKQVESELKTAEKLDQALGTILEEVLNITEEEVKEKYLNYNDNWFTAKEGENEGFYTDLINKKGAKTPKGVINMSNTALFEKYAAVTFPTIKDTNEKNKKMSKPNSYPQLENALGLESPLASNENGSFLNEEQKQTLENKIAGLQTQVKNAEDAAVKAEEATTEAVTALQNVAALAGVENLAEDATVTAIETATTEKVKELNAAPGEKHTNAAADTSDEGEHSYIDFENSSIYKN